MNKILLITTLVFFSVSVIEGFFLYQKSNAVCDETEHNEKMGKHTKMKSEELPKQLYDAPVPKGDIPEDGFVPDHQTAIKIAESIWLPIYGEKIYQEKPFNTVLMDDSLWLVSGTLPDSILGGTVFLKMRKKDAKIIMVTHYK